MTGKSVRDVERYQAVLAGLLAEDENKFCADCQAKGWCGCLIPGIIQGHPAVVEGSGRALRSLPTQTVPCFSDSEACCDPDLSERGNV